MVFGRATRGPLAVIQDSWSGVTPKEPVTVQDHKARSYIDSLQEELQLAAMLAKEHSEIEQKRYLDIHNKCAKEKVFQVGDMVLALLPSSSSKILSTWQGPGTVTNIVNKNTYRVVFQSNSEKILHADLLRKFHTRVNALGVVSFDADTDDVQFGDRERIPLLQGTASCFEEELSKLDLAYLSGPQQSELRAILLKFRAVFNDKPGLCKFTIHQIDTVPYFSPKPQRTYRIPEALVPEVERQLQAVVKPG